MKYDPITRRHFLQGAGGFLLAAPFLPSILAPAEARAACLGPEPRFVALFGRYGNVAADRWFPNENEISWSTQQLNPDHLIRSGDIPSSVSQIFPSFLFGSLRQKLAFHIGLDFTQRTAHSNGNLLGPFVTNETGGPKTISLDQVLARELSQNPIAPSVVYGNDAEGSCSYGLTPAGVIQNIAGFNSAQAAFLAIFGGSSGGGVNHAPVVDRVYQDFNSFRNHPRLGSVDRQTLEQVIARIDDLQSRLNANIDCTNVEEPGYINTWQNFANQIIEWDNYADLLVAAFQCCITRVSTFLYNRYTHPDGDDFHDDSHASYTVAGQAELTSIFQDWGRYFYHAFISKMDAVLESNGRTMLDNSYVIMGMENSGTQDHTNYANSIITAGSANNAFLTGKVFDWRNHQSPYGVGSYYNQEQAKPGVAYPQFMWTILKGFGLSDQQIQQYIPNDSRYSRGGFGAMFQYGGASQQHPDTYGNIVTPGSTLLSNHYPQNFNSVLGPMLV